ncbi:MAG TPA: aldehyde dehydrogenase family protein [Oscillatoriaceae cyanobacterium]
MSTTIEHLLPELEARRGLRHGHFIAGIWRAPAETFERHNPADVREIVGHFARGGADDVAAAVAAAKQAFPAWRDTPQAQRGQILMRASQLLAARAEELAQAMTWEEGKALAEARQELQRAVAYLEFVAGEGRRFGGEVYPADGPGVNYVVRKPRGVVGLIAPWNFPVNTPVIKSAPALLTGNTVVFKPSEHSPLTAALLAEVYAAAGVPAGVFNVVFGDGAAGRALVAHPDVRAISFTGSTAVGRAINQVASERFARVQLEMGGKNASIVLADADLERAAADVAIGGFSVSGERCNANSLVLVAASVFEDFAAKLVAKASALRVGNGLEDGAQVGPLVTESALARVSGYVERARADGAAVLCGGRVLDEGALQHGHFYAPTVLTGLGPAHPVCREEIFGPVVTLVPVADLESAIAVANALPYGLASSLYTRDLASAMQYVKRLETGLVHVNCATTVSELQMPYGGMKDSGHGGREMGRYVLDFYTEPQAVYLRY